jgi:hypothetical protein
LSQGILGVFGGLQKAHYYATSMIPGTNILGNVRTREWWNPKYRKFQPPIKAEPPPDQQIDMESQVYSMSESNFSGSFPPLS